MIETEWPVYRVTFRGPEDPISIAAPGIGSAMIDAVVVMDGLYNYRKWFVSDITKIRQMPPVYISPTIVSGSGSEADVFDLVERSPNGN
jgi:hypothetical protein